MSPESVGKRARELFTTGLNCAESVLLANLEALGVEGEWLPRIATGFGSGIATTQQVCGVISGAVMTAGWVLGRERATQASSSRSACNWSSSAPIVLRGPSHQSRLPTANASVARRRL
jgi:hypothetical protein